MGGSIQPYSYKLLILLGKCPHRLQSVHLRRPGPSKSLHCMSLPLRTSRNATPACTTQFVGLVSATGTPDLRKLLVPDYRERRVGCVRTQS